MPNTINALRGHLAEHGLVAATGTAQLKRLADAIEDSATAWQALRTRRSVAQRFFVGGDEEVDFVVEEYAIPRHQQAAIAVRSD